MGPGHGIQQFDEIAFRLELRVQLRQIVTKLAGLVNVPHQVAHLAFQINRIRISRVVRLPDNRRNNPAVQRCSVSPTSPLE